MPTAIDIIKGARANLGWSDEDHAQHIGRVSAGSAAAILGHCQYGTPLERYESIVDGSSLSLNSAMEYGLRSELSSVDWLLDLYEAGLAIGGAPLINMGGAVFSPTNEWLMATPDAYVYDEGESHHWGDRPRWNVQIKTHRFMPKNYGDDIRRKDNHSLVYPLREIANDKLCQVLVEQHCCDSKLGSILFVICLTDSVPRVIFVPRLPDLEGELIGCLKDFYDCHVVPKFPPSADHAGFASPEMDAMIDAAKDDLRIRIEG